MRQSVCNIPQFSNFCCNQTRRLFHSISSFSHKRAISQFAALTVVAFCLALPAPAQSGNTRTQPVTELNFGILNLVPYGYKDGRGSIKGYYFESARALLDDAGYAYRLALQPAKRFQREVEQNRTDCVFVIRNHFTESIFRFVEPIGEGIPIGVVASAGGKLSQYNDLSSHSIGVSLGVTTTNRFDSDDSLNKVETPNYSRSVEMLLRGRLSAIAGNIDAFRYFATQSGKNPKNVFGEKLIFAHIPIWLACGKSRPEDAVLARLKASMIKLRNDGTFKRIISEFR